MTCDFLFIVYIKTMREIIKEGSHVAFTMCTVAGVIRIVRIVDDSQ